MPIALMLAGLPLVMFGAFSRTYTINSLGSCIFVDGLKLGPFCFPVGSMLPEIIVFGAMALGLGLVLLGNIKMRAARQAAKPN